MSTQKSHGFIRLVNVVVIVLVLIPLFFGGVRTARAGTLVVGLGQTYTTIQSAVDAAIAGDTVEVKAGTYIEQVTIQKDLTLITTEAAVIQAFDSMTQDCTSPSLPENRPIVCVNNGASVTIDGFVIDGASKGDTNVRLMGIAYRNAGGVVQHNTIKDIKFAAISSKQEGVGIYLYNSDVTARTFTVTNNTISNFNKNGINLTTGESFNGLTFLISNNIITGFGTNQYSAQNGIQVRAPRGSGVIRDNTISDVAFNNVNNSQPLVAVGILNFSTPVDSLNNTITNSQVGIVYSNDDKDLGTYREISGNQIDVFKPGVSPNLGQNVYGILITDRLKDLLSPVDPPTLGALNAILSGNPLSVAITDNEIKFTGIVSNAKTIGIEIDAGIGTNTQSGGIVPGDNVLSVNISSNHIYGPTLGFDAGLVIYQCDPADLPMGAVTFCGSGTIDTSSVVSNNIHGNNYGIIFEGPIEMAKLDDFHHNRIVGNGVGVLNNTPSDILMINNWWGCSGGPGSLDCDTIVGNTLGFENPWLVLTTTAAPATIGLGETSSLTADLNHNSDGIIPLGGIFVPEGIPVTFSAKTEGTVNPPSGVTASGAASTTFTPPVFGGTYDACATVDSQTTCSAILYDVPVYTIFLPIISK